MFIFLFYFVKLRHKGRVTTTARANYCGSVLPIPPCQHSLWEETGVPEKTHDFRQSVDKSHSERLWKTIDDVTARKHVSRPTCIISEEGVVKTDSKSIAEALNLHVTTIGSMLRNVLKTKIVHYFTSHT